MPDNHVPLKKLFLNLQKQMAQALLTARDSIPHQGVKGDTSEECWRGMLKKYLPQRYRVEKAFVIDSKDKCSDQIDIVIFDQQYSPFLFNQDGAVYVPAESVYAVIEAKQELDKGTIEYAAQKAESVRRLKRTSAAIYWAQGKMTRRDLHAIPAGILALTSGWKPPLGGAFEGVIKNTAKKTAYRIDFGCTIKGGAFSIEYLASDPSTPVIGKSAANVTLVTFFLQLVARLQQLGTVPAIDIPEYLKALSST